MNILRNRTRTLLTPIAVAAIAVGVAACGDDDGDSDASDASGGVGGSGEVVVTDPWVRQPAEGQPNAAAYGVITNETDDEVTLVGASVDGVGVETIEIHETLTDDEGTMSMQEKEGGFAIAAGDSFVLEPGGPHVMLLGIDPAEFTSSIELTLEFDGADPVTVSAEVRAIDGDAMGDMDHDDMDDMDDDDMDDMNDDDMDDDSMDDMDDDG